MPAARVRGTTTRERGTLKGLFKGKASNIPTEGLNGIPNGRDVDAIVPDITIPEKPSPDTATTIAPTTPPPPAKDSPKVEVGTPQSSAAAVQRSIARSATVQPPIEFREFAPRIAVVGVGGAGGNAVNNMVSRGLSPHKKRRAPAA